MLPLISAFMLNTSNVSAQGLYAGIEGGYNFPVASGNLTSKFDGGLTSQTNELVKGSYGKGMDFGLYGGYMLNSNLGAELGFSYLSGAQYTGSYIKETVLSNTTLLSARMMRFSPGVRMALGEKKLKPFLKIGLVVGLGGKITATETDLDMQTATTSQKTTQYTGGVSIGVCSSIGATYTLTDLISLFGEVTLVSQSWAPSTSNVTSYSVNGTDKLSTLSGNQKQTNYSSSYSTSAYSPPSINDPAQALKNYFPFSSAGIQVGIHFKFKTAK
jgi:hypothetical protein